MEWMSRPLTPIAKDPGSQRPSTLAKTDTPPISDLIQTETRQRPDQDEYACELELVKIRADQDLCDSIARGLQDSTKSRGTYL